jgi:type II secretory pathway component GspD/PulD (secretin)
LVPGTVNPSAAAIREPSLTTIRLKNAEAEETAGILEKVFSRDAPEVTPFPRTNSIIIRADDKTLKEIKALLMELDAPEQSSGAAGPRPSPAKR